MIQDSGDFLWFGTLGGLNKYDGRKIIVYRHEQNNSNSLSHNYVHALYEDKQGIIWIATDTAITHFDPRTENFRHFKPFVTEDTRSNNVMSIIADSENMLWIGTRLGLVR